MSGNSLPTRYGWPLSLAAPGERGDVMLTIGRLAHWDVADRGSSLATRLLLQLGFGFACATVMIVLRMIVDGVAPTAGPFALVYPTVLIATLYGRWQAGIAAYLIAFTWTWFFLIPIEGSFEFLNSSDPSRVLMHGLSALIVIVFAEIFRRAMKMSIVQCGEEIDRRMLLAKELEHRTRNNFAIVVSLLDLQKREAGSSEVTHALGKATDRINAFVSAFDHLALGQGDEEPVLMEQYLTELADRIGQAAFSEAVQISTSVSPIALPPKVAVPIGLFLNEALTNCSKYAFPGGRDGIVEVRLTGDEDSWSLEICDNGCGDQHTPSTHNRSGSGTRIMKAIAQQAGARQEVTISDQGCTAILTKV